MEQLKEILRKRKQNTQKQKRARALPLVDKGCTDEAAGEQTGMSRRGLEQLRKRFVEEGFEATITGKSKGHRPKSPREKDEARLVALVCGPKPGTPPGTKHRVCSKDERQCRRLTEHNGLDIRQAD